MPQLPKSTLTRDEISARIAEKAWHDPAFHQRVLADANAAYEEATGLKVPPGVTLKVIEDDAHTINFVIPPRPAATSELSDADLESVAGGSFLNQVSQFVYGVSVAIQQAETHPASHKW
jgi:hypothetical protein